MDIVPLVLSIIGLGVTLLLTLIACMYRISGKLSKIEDNTRVISDIRNELTKLAERIDMAIRYGLQPSRATIDLTLQNLGRVHVSAEPRKGETLYRVTFDKANPVVDSGFIARRTKETGFAEKERELLSGKEAQVQSLASQLLIIIVPSSDPQVCSTHMGQFLKWLDGTTVESQKAIQEYERITV